MLILTRKEYQSIIIAKNIEVIVCKIRGGQITLSINAPEDVEVNREEIFIKKYGTEDLIKIRGRRKDGRKT